VRTTHHRLSSEGSAAGSQTLPPNCVAVDPTTTIYRKGKRVDETVPLDGLAELSRQPDAFVWVDLPHPHEDVLNQLATEFGLHPLAVEDALHAHQRPKIERYDTFFTIVTYAAAMKDDHLELHEITVFVSRDYVVTVRHTTGDDLAELRARLDSTQSELDALEGGFFAYALLDQVVDGYFIAVDSLEDRIESLEEELVYRSDSSTGLGSAFAARRDVIYFRRAVAPLREVLNVLLRRDETIVRPELDTYVRDLYDHVVRVSEDLDTFHDLISASLEAHLSVISNRMNEVVLKVSAWAAIIALPTVIASIYGMNFARMPELSWHLGYPYALGLMAASALGLFAYFKRRRWL
jgi:magnesium transporter